MALTAAQKAELLACIATCKSLKERPVHDRVPALSRLTLTLGCVLANDEDLLCRRCPLHDGLIAAVTRLWQVVQDDALSEACTAFETLLAGDDPCLT